MARTNIAPQLPSAEGITPSYAAVDNANGMKFKNSGRGILHIKASGTVAVTILMPQTVEGVALVNGGKIYSLTTGNDKMFSYRNLAPYVQADGYVYLDFSTANGTIGLFEGGQA